MAVLSLSKARAGCRDHRRARVGAESTPRSRARVSRMIGVDAWDLADIAAAALILAVSTWGASAAPAQSINTMPPPSQLSRNRRKFLRRGSS